MCTCQTKCSIFTRIVNFCVWFAVGHSVRLFGTKKAEGKKLGGARLDLPKIRKNPLIEIIAINTGYVGMIKVPHILK